MELWIPITLSAALFQTWRTALQQRLRQVLSVNAAGFVRYLYGVPVGAALLAGGLLVTGVHLAPPNRSFFINCALGGLLQIIGTVLLIMAFGFRSFAVGSAYAKTEGVQTAIVGWLVLGERLPAAAWLGIAVSVGGVLTLSLAGRPPRELLRATFQPAALCGLGTGLCFAFTSITIKEANRALGPDHPVLQAMFVLLVTNVMQTLMQGAWLAVREPEQLRGSFLHWRRASWVGVLSGFGSACWFSAFALAKVGLVRTLGQVEMPCILLFSRFYLKERIRPAEAVGLALVLVGVGVVMLAVR